MTHLPIQFISGGIMIDSTEVTIADVARYILEKCGQMTTMKLQKLCYYSQVWHSYFVDEPLFRNEYQAWSYGPVSYDLFVLHRGKYNISPEDFQYGSPERISTESLQIIDEVLSKYSSMSGAQLSELSHTELPWIASRSGVDTFSSSPVISISLMKEFAAQLNEPSKP
jgi:uncharacterized phage-associated protein